MKKPSKRRNIGRNARMLPNKSHKQYEALWNGLRNSLQPEGAAEEIMLERLAVLLWRGRLLTSVGQSNG
jgi:hypothetical protein